MNNDIYFAPGRLAGGVNWVKTSIFDSETSLWLGGLFQMDMNFDSAVKVNSQYLAAKVVNPLNEKTNIEYGLIAEMIEETDRDFRFAFAASVDMQWLSSGKNPGIFSLGGRFSSGEWFEGITAFTPLTGVSQGKVLRPNLSGIALVQVEYFSRLNRGLFLELFAAYLFRTDTVFYGAPGINYKSDSPLLGPEIYVNLSWSPLSDLFFSAGGGLFFPELGDVFGASAGIKYRLEITAGISI